MNLLNNLSHTVESAFSAQNHGIFSGSWSDFQMAVDRVVNLVPHATSGSLANTTDTVSSAFGRAENNLLSPLTWNPSFYVLGGIGILLLLVIGYGMIKF